MLQKDDISMIWPWKICASASDTQHSRRARYWTAQESRTPSVKQIYVSVFATIPCDSAPGTYHWPVSCNQDRCQSLLCLKIRPSFLRLYLLMVGSIRDLSYLTYNILLNIDSCIISVICYRVDVLTVFSIYWAKQNEIIQILTPIMPLYLSKSSTPSKDILDQLYAFMRTHCVPAWLMSSGQPSKQDACPAINQMSDSSVMVVSVTVNPIRGVLSSAHLAKLWISSVNSQETTTTWGYPRNTWPVELLGPCNDIGQYRTRIWSFSNSSRRYSEDFPDLVVGRPGWFAGKSPFIMLHTVVTLLLWKHRWDDVIKLWYVTVNLTSKPDTCQIKDVKGSALTTWRSASPGRVGFPEIEYKSRYKYRGESRNRDHEWVCEHIKYEKRTCHWVM